METFVAGKLLPNVDSEVVSEPVVQVEDVTDVKAVEAEFPAELEEEVWVVPKRDLRAVLADVESVEHAQVGLQGDHVGFEFGLETETKAGAVDLSVVVEVVLHFVVLDFCVRNCVEFDDRLAGELSVELDLVIGGVVVVEERC